METESYPVSKSDVTWIDQDNKKHKLHSIVLSLQSKVFRTMYESETSIEHEMLFPSTTINIFIKLMYDVPIIHVLICDDILNLWKFTHQYECKLENYVIDLIMSPHLNISQKYYFELFQFACQVKHKKVIRHFIDFFANHRSHLISYFESQFKMADNHLKFTRCDTLELKQVVFELEPIEKHDVFWIDVEGHEYCLHSAVLQHQSPVFLEMYKDKTKYYNIVNFSTSSLRTFCHFIYDTQSISKLSNELLIEILEICLLFQCCIDIVWEKIIEKFFKNQLCTNDQLYKLSRVILLHQDMKYITYFYTIMSNYNLSNILAKLFDAEEGELD
jgi:hypothetical protein